jgi:hypothetical protein
MDRNELGALFVAAGLGPPAEHTLISLLALNGLRVSEATGSEPARREWHPAAVRYGHTGNVALFELLLPADRLLLTEEISRVVTP